jgi:hypothetical protein
VVIYLATREEFLQQVLEQRFEEVVRQCYAERSRSEAGSKAVAKKLPSAPVC